MSNDRRDFLKLAGIGVIAACSQFNPSKAFAADPGPVDPKDKMAQDLGYTTDATKVDTKKWSKRAGADGAKQFCNNCMFYQAKSEPLKTKSAPCQIFAGKTVPAKAWCNSWTQNPNVKA